MLSISGLKSNKLEESNVVLNEFGFEEERTPDGIRLIDKHTLFTLLHEKKLQTIQVVDCRSPDEFDNCHLCGAINVWSTELLKSTFPLELSGPPGIVHSTLYIFHCEYSTRRSVKALKALQRADKEVNDFKVAYPNVFLLQGGLHEFFDTFKSPALYHVLPKSFLSFDDVANPTYFNTF